jgi:cytochrome c oxidase subunit 2
MALAGCGEQSQLSPHSNASRAINVLWWWMLVAATIVFAGSVGLLVIAWLRRRREGLPFFAASKRMNMGLVVVFGTAIPITVNVALFIASNFVVLKRTEAPAVASTAMTIDVIGHQWFWEVRYPGTKAVTANEIHIPAGTRVNVVATTADVIHSFWVPQLNRKIDMIPGRRNRVLLYADKPGRYRGQCAEFCGADHAKMALYVFADQPAKFRAWLANEASDVRRPPVAQFMSEGCDACHALRGTPARGAIGPDLTHVGSRTTLAALTIPNTRAGLAAWLRDPQAIKPGNRMPALGLSSSDINALVDYLEGLR